MKKILFLLPRFPYPLHKGDQLRAFYQIRELSYSCEVSVFALTDRKISDEDKQNLSFVKHLQIVTLNKTRIAFRLMKQVFSSEPFQSAYFYDTIAEKELSRFIESVKPDVIFCQLARMAKYCERINHPAKILDYQDAFSAGLKRRIQNSNFLYRILLKTEYKRMLSYESQIFRLFDAHIIISDQDRALIQHSDKKKIIIVPNGVDTTFFSPNPDKNTQKGLLFTGNMAYFPNIQCVQYISKEVLPLLPEKYHTLPFIIAGAEPTAAVKKLANENTIVTGSVPELLSYYRQAAIFAAPMLTGIGMQNKILEAMSIGLPCITSSLANNAIKAIHGVHLFVCDSPQAIANTIVMLIENPKIRIEIGQNARKFIVENYTWAAQNEKLLLILNTFLK